MDANFWISKWQEGQIGFHKENYNESLLKHFGDLHLKKGNKILVPLCGKTKDLAWLYQEGLDVLGVELYEKAIEAFFVENGFNNVTRTADDEFIKYSVPKLELLCGDFFKLNIQEKLDAVYDRASLVALPPEMRRTYAQVVTNALKKGGKYLLIVYSYDQEEMAGPPFSVDAKEVRDLYGEHFSVTLLESESPVMEGPRLSAIPSFKQSAYLLEKLS